MFVPSASFEALQHRARAEGTTVNELAERMIQAALDHEAATS